MHIRPYLLSVVAVVAVYQQGLLMRSLYAPAMVNDIMFDTPTTSEMSLAAKAPQEVKTAPPRRKWAYAFLVAGCDSQSLEYRGFIYNAVVAASKLRQGGSKADIVVMVQMSSLTDEKALPEEDLHLLKSMNVKVHYLPKFLSKHSETFYAVVMEKFRVLQMLEYSRVLFLDGDIMPWCSLDYIFELSEPANSQKALLKENVVLSWKSEAVNAGFFMVQPGEGEFEQIQQVIEEKERKALRMKYPHWDEVEGWGHKIDPSDPWRNFNGDTGVLWAWHAVFADQGLLYYWTKYIKKSVSFIIKNEVDNWGVSKNGTLVLENTLVNEINNQSCSRGRALVPYADFKHFTGRSKPWYQDFAYLNSSLWKPSKKRNPTEEWYHELVALGSKLNITIDLNISKEEHHRSPVGMHSSYGPMIKHIRAKRRNNGTAYAQE